MEIVLFACSGPIVVCRGLCADGGLDADGEVERSQVSVCCAD